MGRGEPRVFWALPVSACCLVSMAAGCLCGGWHAAHHTHHSWLVPTSHPGSCSGRQVLATALEPNSACSAHPRPLGQPPPGKFVPFTLLFPCRSLLGCPCISPPISFTPAQEPVVVACDHFLGCGAPACQARQGSMQHTPAINLPPTPPLTPILGVPFGTLPRSAPLRLEGCPRPNTPTGQWLSRSSRHCHTLPSKSLTTGAHLSMTPCTSL